MKIVDSSVWIDYFNGKMTRETNLLHHLLSSEPVSIGNIILTEVMHIALTIVHICPIFAKLIKNYMYQTRQYIIISIIIPNSGLLG